MTTRYEFGYGYGEIYRRRMRRQEQVHREMMQTLKRFPEEDRERARYESDYYGFRGAGHRGSYAAEYHVRPRSAAPSPDGGSARPRTSRTERRRRR